MSESVGTNLITTFNVNYHGRDDESMTHAVAVAASLDAAICDKFGKRMGDCDFGCEYCAPHASKCTDLTIDYDRDKLKAVREAARLLDDYDDLRPLADQLTAMATLHELQADEQMVEAEKWLYSWLFYNVEDVPYDIDEAEVFDAAQDRGEDGHDAVTAWANKRRYDKGMCANCGEDRLIGSEFCAWHHQKHHGPMIGLQSVA